MECFLESVKSRGPNTKTQRHEGTKTFETLCLGDEKAQLIIHSLLFDIDE
jgi:hypothetical protein